MDNYDYEDRPNPLARIMNVFWNILTVIILLVLLYVVFVTTMIFINPNSGLNPFPPPTQPYVLQLPTLTPTLPNVLPPTWTPTMTLEPTITNTPEDTPTPEASATPFVFATPLPSTPVSAEGYKFSLKGERPLAIPNIAHSELSCNWMGVAGQIEDLSGGPLTQVIVALGGTLDGQPVDISGMKLTLSGSAPIYGQSGYEFVLADKPIKSTGSMWVQLLDQSQLPISNRIYFDTYDVCEKNLIVISFKQVR